MATYVFGTPPVQVMFNPFARVTELIAPILVQLIGFVSEIEVVKAPTCLPPLPVNVKAPPVEGRKEFAS